MTDSLKPEIELRKPELTSGLVSDRDGVQMEQERNPIFSIDIQFRFRGAVYKFDMTRVLRWLVPLIVVFAKGLLLYHRQGP